MGDVSVLVAVAGEPEDVADAHGVLERLGDRLGEVILARPIASSWPAPAAWDGAIETGFAELSRAAVFVPLRAPRLFVVGRPAGRAVARLAIQQGAHGVFVAGHPAIERAVARITQAADPAIVVGSRRSGLDHWTCL